MPIHDSPEPESPHVDTRMFEFVERRREEQARARRQRIQIVAIVALGLVGIILAVSNAILVSRLVARPLTPPVATPPLARSAAPVTPVEREPAARVAKSARVSDEPRERATPRLAEEPSTPEPSRGDEPVTREPSSDERPSLPDRVARATPRPAPASVRPPAPRESLSTAVETDPALRTARWMIHTYGPLDAEGKALAAARFYTGQEGAFWRRVVAHVRAER